MNCPRCKSDSLKERTLTGLNNEKVQVDICTICQGIWLDKGELEQTLKLKKDPLTLQDYIRKETDIKKNPEMKCPRCNEELIEIPAMKKIKVKMDICESCDGIWLDCGELEILKDKTKHTRFFQNIFSVWQEMGVYYPIAYSEVWGEHII